MVISTGAAIFIAILLSLEYKLQELCSVPSRRARRKKVNMELFREREKSLEKSSAISVRPFDLPLWVFFDGAIS